MVRVLVRATAALRAAPLSVEDSPKVMVKVHAKDGDLARATPSAPDLWKVAD